MEVKGHSRGILILEVCDVEAKAISSDRSNSATQRSSHEFNSKIVVCRNGKRYSFVECKEYRG